MKAMFKTSQTTAQGWNSDETELFAFINRSPTQTEDEFYIDEDELRNHPALYEARKTLRKLSKEADKDSDGHITPFELKSFLVASHQMLEKLRPDEAEEEMKDDDEDKDGEEESNETYAEEGEGGDDAEPTNPTKDSNKPETQADSNPADKEGTKGKK